MNRIEKIKEMLTTSPKDNFLRHALALEYLSEGNEAEAKQLFIDVLTDSPDYVGSYYQLAKLLEKQEDTTAAISWYEKGMQAAKEAGNNRAYNELQSAYEELIY